MAVLPLTYFPDPLLSQETQHVDSVSSDIQQLLDDMVETMRAANGVGLAGPQIGQGLRLCVVDVGEPVPMAMDDESAFAAARTNKVYHFINPQITERSDETITWEEGCLSIPEYLRERERAMHISVTALDRDGKEFTLQASGLLSVAIQHEVDHLDGKLIIDGVSRLKKDMYLRKLRKILAAQS